MAFKTLKFEFTEVVVPAGSTATRFNFPDLPKLRYTSLQALETWVGDGDGKTGKCDILLSPNNNPIFPVNTIIQSYLVLYLNERQDVYRVPLITLHRTQTGTENVPFVRSLFEFTGQKVTWDKSYIEVAQSITPTVQTSFAFGIYYA